MDCPRERSYRRASTFLHRRFIYGRANDDGDDSILDGDARGAASKAKGRQVAVAVGRGLRFGMHHVERNDGGQESECGGECKQRERGGERGREREGEREREREKGKDFT